METTEMNVMCNPMAWKVIAEKVDDQVKKMVRIAEKYSVQMQHAITNQWPQKNMEEHTLEAYIEFGVQQKTIEGLIGMMEDQVILKDGNAEYAQLSKRVNEQYLQRAVRMAKQRIEDIEGMITYLPKDRKHW